MASVGLTVQSPLSISSNDGPYTLIKSYPDSVRQNLKMLILTAPGERIQVPPFGVGIKRFLFEPLNETTKELIRFSINSQISIYMPYIVGFDVQIDNVSDLVYGENEKEENANAIAITLSYDVNLSSTKFSDFLKLEVR